jgi:hypothetical protein
MSSANGSNLRNWHYVPKRWGVHQDPYRQNRHHQNRIIARTQSRISRPISNAIEHGPQQNRRLSEIEWLRRKMSRAIHHFKKGLPNADKA